MTVPPATPWHTLGPPALGGLLDGLLAQGSGYGVSVVQTVVTLMSAGLLTTLGLGIKWAWEARQKAKEVDRQAKERDRKDALEEWKEYAGKLEADLAKREAINEKLVARVTRYSVMITALQGRVDVLESATSLLHAGADPFIVYQFTNPVGQIITDEAGLITDVDFRVRPILHYQKSEMVGKNVAILIPPEYREAHRAFMERARDPAVPLDPRNVLSLVLMTREGTRVPVNLRLLRWQESGHWQFTAYIQERDITPMTNGNGGSHSGDSGAFLRAGDPAGDRATAEMATVATPTADGTGGAKAGVV